MAKVSFDMPEFVTLAAQGKEFSVNPADFAAIAFEGIFTYGLRRWFQDNINSQAHAWRKASDAGEVSGEFDVDASFLARLEQAKSGTMQAPRASASSPALSAFDETLYAVAVEVKAKVKPLADAWAASKGLATAERKAAILAAVAALPEPTQGKLRAAAQVRHDALAGLEL